MLPIKLSITCNSLLSKAYSLKHYSAISCDSQRMICYILRYRVSSIGSLKFRPQVIVGLLAKIAVQQTDSLAIGSNYFEITRRIIKLQKYSSRQRSYPKDYSSYFPKVTVYTTKALAYLQTTFAMIRSNTDWATRQSLSYLGYIFLLTKNPRTKACIFLSLYNPSFLIVSFISNYLFQSNCDF